MYCTDSRAGANELQTWLVTCRRPFGPMARRYVEAPHTKGVTEWLAGTDYASVLPQSPRTLRASSQTPAPATNARAMRYAHTCAHNGAQKANQYCGQI